MIRSLLAFGCAAVVAAQSDADAMAAKACKAMNMTAKLGMVRRSCCRRRRPAPLLTRAAADARLRRHRWLFA